MKALLKTVSKSLKFTPAEWREVERAARQESRKEQKIVAPITLAHDVVMEGVRARLTDDRRSGEDRRELAKVS